MKYMYLWLKCSIYCMSICTELSTLDILRNAYKSTLFDMFFIGDKISPTAYDYLVNKIETAYNYYCKFVK